MSAGEEGDLDRLGDQGLLAHQDDVPGIERPPKRGSRSRPEAPRGPSRPRACAGEDDEHAGEAEQRGEDRAPLDPLLEDERGEIERDQRRDEGERDALRQRHPRQPPEEEDAPCTEDIMPRMRWIRIAARDGRGLRARPEDEAADQRRPTSIRQSIAL